MLITFGSLSQLPYLIDGKTKLTQSNAILRYIARKHKMCEYFLSSLGSGLANLSIWNFWSPLLPPGGETEEEISRVDMLENQVMDFRMSLVMVCYNPDFVSSLAFVKQELK